MVASALLVGEHGGKCIDTINKSHYGLVDHNDVHKLSLLLCLDIERNPRLILAHINGVSD